MIFYMVIVLIFMLVIGEKRKRLGLENGLISLKHWLLLQRTQVDFPATNYVAAHHYL